MSIHLVFKERPAEARLFVCDFQHLWQGCGGGDGTRTHDHLVANQVLYQLSYAPIGAVTLPVAHYSPARDGAP